MPHPGEILNDVYDATNHLLKTSAGGGGGGGVSAVYNTTPPTYTNGATASLQTDVNGNLKTVILDAIAPTSANLTAADAGSTVATGFNGSSIITGTPTAGSFLEIAFNGENAVAIQLAGTWVASVVFERSIDNGVTYHPATIISSGQNYSTITGNGLFFINAAGANKARVRVPSGSFTSGPIAASLYAATGIFPLSLISAVSGMYNANAPTLSDKGVSALQLDPNGNLRTTGSNRSNLGNQQTTITSSTSETTIATAVASTFLDVYGIIIANTSATATKVTIKDATGGTTRFVIQVPAGDTRGFMLPAHSAHKQATVNNNWTATSSTSVASLEITAMFVKNT